MTKAKVKTADKKPSCATRVGNKVFIRTVTFHYTGEIVSVSKETIVLVKAAWIADSGRFFQALTSGMLNEVEPYPKNAHVDISRGAVVDVSDWFHDLPRNQK